MGKDAIRRLEEEAGVKRPPRPRALSGAYLEQALAALHAAGDPAVLYPDWARSPTLPAEPARALAVLLAAREHVRQCRTAVLFTALAAESYVNEFLATQGLSETKLKKIHGMSTPLKYSQGTTIAYGERLFTRGHPDRVIEMIERLFDVRHELVHPKPGRGPALLLERSNDFDRLFSPSKAANYIVAVAGAAAVLMRRAYGLKTLDIPADFIWTGRNAVYAYARNLSELPDSVAARPAALFEQVLDRVKEINARHRAS